MKFWGSFKIKYNTLYSTRLGLLWIYLLKEKNELNIADKQPTDIDEEPGKWETISMPLDLSEEESAFNWKRSIISEKDNLISFVPVLPNRPILVKPESQIQILPGNSATFYVSIPVWVRITIGDGEVLTEIPTIVLSNTWFGEPLSGELCYALKSKAMTNFEKRRVKVYSANCPIQIHNHSSRSFIFQRILVHTEFLGIYGGVKHLWTNQIEVRIEGANQKSYIDISDGAPEHEKTSEQLSVSREVPSKKLYRKMFADLPFVRG